MSVEVTLGYAGYPAKVVVRDDDTEYTITTQTIRFDQFDHGTPFLKVERKQVERVRRCQAAVPRKAKDFTGKLDRDFEPNELLSDQCRRAAWRDADMCQQHRQSGASYIGDADEYLD